MARKAKPIARGTLEARRKPGQCPCAEPCDWGKQVTTVIPTHADSMALLAGLVTEAASHPDADLLEMIDQATDLHGQIEAARRRGGAHKKAMLTHCQEATALSNRIAATPARTMEGLRAKAVYAMGDQGPEAPLNTAWVYAPAFSALRDFLMMGRAA